MSIRLFAMLAATASLGAAALEIQPVALGEEKAAASVDYFAWDPQGKRLWVPVGNTGSVAVLDAAGKVTTITGFATREVERNGRKYRLGPTSATIGDGVVYVGNRSDTSVCVLDAAAMSRGPCLELARRAENWAGGPDGVVYVAATKEVWITRGGPPKDLAAPDLSLDVLDASDPRALKKKATVPPDGIAEGYAVDDARGLFYTNLEDRGETVAIDVRAHKVASRWKTCDDPRGLAIDLARQLLFVACPGRVISLDLKAAAKELGSVATGAGLDFIDYSERDHLLYAASGRTAVLTVARVAEGGAISTVATVPTVMGARSVVAGAPGTAYVADPQGGRILVVR